MMNPNSEKYVHDIFLQYSKALTVVNSLLVRPFLMSRETEFSGANRDRELLIFRVQLTTS